MASTLLFKSARKYYNVHAPPTSPAFQMPNVFVIPPEEEQFQTPPWCYFDAADTPQQDLSTRPDFNSLDAALDILHKAEHDVPQFRRSTEGELGDIVMPKKREKLSGLENIVDLSPREDPTNTRPVDVSNDSVVIEVVKVRKSDVPGAIGLPVVKRSKTFKARASRAFRSIRNVGRGTQRKTSIKENCPSSNSLYSMDSRQTLRQNEQTPSPAHQLRDRTLPRRASITLSHLFQSPEALPVSDLPSSSEPELNSASPPESSSATDADSSPSLREQTDRPPSETDSDGVGPRSSSPCPSTTRSFRQRFSVIDLHRLFSFAPSASKASSSLASTTSTISTPSTPSMSRGPSTISSSSDAPDTPVDGAGHINSEYDKFAAGSRDALSYNDEPRILRDISFEMRLDSLHFDCLSFDADNF